MPLVPNAGTQVSICGRGELPRSQAETVLKTIDAAQTRRRAMDRALRQVESLPEQQCAAVLPLPAGADETDTDPDSDAIR